MATYFKYAERSANNQINWAEIGKNLTDTLQEENKLREQKKAAIDEATRQYGLTLEQSHQGEDRSFNQWGLDFAAEAQQARLLQDRLLKQGKLKLKDYTMMRQNLTDGTNQAFSLMDEYNAEYKKKMDRAKSMDPATASQYLEQWKFAQSEGFANFKNSQLYINPTTYAVSVALKKKGTDGVMVMSHDPNEFTTVNALRNNMKATHDRFDSDAYLQKQVAMLGKEKRAAIKELATKNKAGTILTKEDITARDGWLTAQDAMIEAAFAGNPTNISSILTDNLGMDENGNKYDFTFNEEDKGKIKDGKNLIYVDGNGEPQFSKEQRDAAKNDMKQKMDMMLNVDETIQTYANPQAPQPSVDLLKYWDDKANVKAGMEQWNNLRSGTYEQKAAAVQYFRGIDSNIVDVRFTSVPDDGPGSGGVEFVYNNGNVVPYWFYDSVGNEISGPSWMNAGNEILGGKVTQSDANTYGKRAKTSFGKDEAEIRASVGSVNQGLDYSTK